MLKLSKKKTILNDYKKKKKKKHNYNESMNKRR